jgi:hypothetical protein
VRANEKRFFVLIAICSGDGIDATGFGTNRLNLCQSQSMHNSIRPNGMHDDNHLVVSGDECRGNMGFLAKWR